MRSERRRHGLAVAGVALATPGINAEAEQREQLIAETEQRITDLKQQIEKARAHEVRWTSALRGPKRSEEID